MIWVAFSIAQSIALRIFSRAQSNAALIADLIALNAARACRRSSRARRRCSPLRPSCARPPPSPRLRASRRPPSCCRHRSRRRPAGRPRGAWRRPGYRPGPSPSAAVEWSASFFCCSVVQPRRWRDLSQRLPALVSLLLGVLLNLLVDFGLRIAVGLVDAVLLRLATGRHLALGVGGRVLLPARPAPWR